MNMSGPLSGVKLIDFSTLLPGPYASMVMADLGADVVRVEAPHRPDPTRFMPPFDGELSAWNGMLGRSKRSIALNLKLPEAVEVVKRLIAPDGAGYDVLLEQFRPGVMDRLGVGYDALREVNPRLIFCSITGYGQTGPLRDRAGHDNNFLSLAGVMSHSGRRKGGPPPLGVQIADVGGGSFGSVVGIMAAIIERQHTGLGQSVDISMFDMSIAWHAHLVAGYLVGGDPPERETARLNGGSFYDYYETKDGRHLSVGSLEPKFWEGFCHAIGREDLVDIGYSLDLSVQHSLKEELSAIIGERTLEQWSSYFSEKDLCVEPVLTVPEMLDHPQTKARKMIVDVPKRDGGSQQQVATPFRFSRSRPRYDKVGAALGADTEQVLAEAGFDAEQVGAMREAGVFG
jgi:crotonobetainyl-CoA:carnitine CoA-transferase CaiB-like acyl-CoA transferase